MTPKQNRFIQEYLIDLNATQAAIRAGYSEATANQQGSRLLANVNIQAELAIAQKALAEKLDISAERIAREYARMGFSDMASFLRFEDGDVYLDFSDLGEDETRAIQEITQEVYQEGRDDSARDVKRTKFKLHDKKGSLDSLAKMMGYSKDRVEHSGEISFVPPYKPRNARD